MLAVAGSVMAAVQFTNNFVQVFKGASLTKDPRVEVIKYNLMTQRALTIAWANRLRSENAETWAIPPESARDAEQILSEMQYYFWRAEAKMDKIYRAPDGKMTSRVFLQRFLFVNGGYEELKSITDALEAMNNTLLVIAPPPPSSSLGEGAPSADTFSPLNPVASVSKPADPTSLPDTANILTRDFSIDALYTVCLKALASICVGTQQDQILEFQYDRLKLWGAGILKTGRSSLDQIFKANPKWHRRFQEVLVRTLVYLAISEGSVHCECHKRVALTRIADVILKLLCASVEELQQRPLARQRREILATLGRDPLSEIAFERWAIILSNEQETNALTRSLPSNISLVTRSVDTEVTTNGTGESQKKHRLETSSHNLPARSLRDNEVVDLETIERETRALEQATRASLQRPEPPNDEMSTSGDQSEEECCQDEITRLGNIIRMLFDLLPAVRRIRRTYLRQLEWEKSGKTILPVEESSSAIAPTDDRPAASNPKSAVPLGLTFDQLLEHSLDLASSLETLLRNDETWAKKNNQQVDVYSGILRKEVGRLQEFKKLNSGKRDSADMHEVIGTIATLGKALNEAIKDIAAPEKPGPWQKTGSTFLLVDAKSPTVNADEKIKEVIAKFAACNRNMWEQSAMVRA